MQMKHALLAVGGVLLLANCGSRNNDPLKLTFPAKAETARVNCKTRETDMKNIDAKVGERLSDAYTASTDERKALKVDDLRTEVKTFEETYEGMSCNGEKVSSFTTRQNRSIDEIERLKE